MAEANLIEAACDQAMKVIGPPIKRQFNYLCCFTSNVNNLKHEAEELDVAERGVQMKVDSAADCAEVIIPAVETLLAKAKEIKDQKTAILEQVPNVGSVCLNLRARFSLSKRATKTAERMKELKEECSKYSTPETAISLPRPPPAGEAVPLRNAYEFESRKKIEEEIMAVLRSRDVSMIGICGMGGLGKTTMAKRIMNRVLEEHVFEEAVIAVVSQPVDKPKIQLEISGSLGLKLEEKESEALKNQKLRARLSNTKKTLLVLDDVWEGIELEEFGIPRDSKGCIILITSRNRDALRAMDVQKEFGMEILSEDEAWFLFRQKAGTCIDAAALKSTAKDVVKECKGLPIALAIVGTTLKDEKDPPVWRDALYQLRRPDHDVPDFIAKVYTPLKLSYDKLSSKQAKSMFLLCCLFPEDANIDANTLACFGMGLGIFEDIEDLEDERNRVSSLIKMLKGRSLLLDSEKGDDHVRMHDVVRDVCIYIAKQEGYVGGNDCYWISSFQMFGERSNLRIGMKFPNLRLLFLSGGRYNSEGVEFKSDKAFFEGISDLYVLCIQYYSSLTSLPLTHSLKNLKSLVLDSCDGVKTISVAGELVNLEIFICRNSPLIDELPLEIKRLNRLKSLDLTSCRNLQRIGPSIISSLFRLEELKMLKSFNRWESEDREERENAGLRELEALTNLRCLEIEVENHALAAEKMHLSSKIKRFRIRIGKSGGGELEFDDDSYMKRLILEPKREQPCLGSSIAMRLLSDTEYLHLSGNSANSVNLAQCQNIRWLELMKCETMKNMTTTPMVIASLDHLSLCNLPQLEGICARPIFTNLSSINIDECHHLCNLGQLSIAGKDCFPQLEKLVIKNCEMMEQVFLWNKEGETKNNDCIIKVFPKLKLVELSSLPNLATFCQGTGCFEFPLLTKFSVQECPKWKSMGSNHNTGGSNADIDDDSSHLFCQPEKVPFPNLKELFLDHQWNPFCGHEISSSLLNGLKELQFSRLHGSRSLFSSAVARNLVNLQRLKINQCDEMLKVIEDEKEDEEEEKGQMPLILFPKLEFLELEELPKLVSFCEWKCDIKLPSLREVHFLGCPDMVNLSLGLLAAPNLEGFRTDLRSNLETEVSFHSLRKLNIYWCEKPFYGHQFFISLLFNGLKELEVYESSMSCLFTSSIARRLDSLQLLVIDTCHKMVKVIEDEENEEEKVGSGDGERTLLFPKLNTLKLWDLPKLENFCEWKCDIELPSLRNLAIMECPVLRNFTMGSIAAAPNLEHVQLEYEIIGGGTKELNSVVQQYREVLKEHEEEERRRGNKG